MINNGYIKIAGLDPSLRNFGVVVGTLTDNEVRITLSSVIQTDRSISDLEAAQTIHNKLTTCLKGVQLIFSELPYGSQSSRASWALGISIGILACLKNVRTVTPRQVKNVTGKRKVEKIDVLLWAMDKHPEVQWIKKRGGGLSEKNSHIADAIGVIYAGLKEYDIKLKP